MGIHVRIGAAVLAAVVLVGCVGCSLFPKEEEALPPPLVKPSEVNYQTQAVAKGTVLNDVTVTGSMQPMDSYNLSFTQRSGYLSEVSIVLGQPVKKGDVLARLDTDSLVSEIQRQKYNVERAQIRYHKVNIVGADASDVRLAQLDLKEQKMLLEELQTTLAKSTIVSPVDGVITNSANKSIGDAVGARETLVTVADTSRLCVAYNGDQVTKFVFGQEVNLFFGSNGTAVAGKVVMTPKESKENADSTDKAAQKKDYVYFQVTGELGDITLKVGDSVKVQLVLDQKADVLVVPTKSLKLNNDIHYVYVLQDGLKVEKIIDIGLSNSEVTEVVSGLSEGDQIIVK